MLLLHLGAFRLDQDSKKTTKWHSSAPRTRVLCILLSVFAIALTPNGHWLTWAFYGVGAIALIFVSRVNIKVLSQRMAVEFAFVGVAILGTLFKDGGQGIWSWGILKITTEGLTVLGSVALKTLLSLLMLNVLTLTTSVPALLNALSALGIPPLLVATLASMYSYIGVLVREFKAMKQAAVSRNLKNNHSWQRWVFSNMIGVLFIRTYERGDKIYQAMLARGYSGVPMMEKAPTGGKMDIFALSLTTFWLVLGQLIYI